MAQKKKKRTLPLGADGAIKLPPDALAALDLNPGDEVEIFVDTRHKQIRLERHVVDPWAEALAQRPQKELEDLAAEQTRREAEADRVFNEKLKEPPGKRRPEDGPDLWR